MSMLICCVNWEAVSAISNIVMAAIAFMSLGVSFYLLHKERKQRIEDNRARIDFSIIKHMHGNLFHFFIHIHFRPFFHL